MGVRGEMFSTKVALQNRTYFFNVKENRLGDLYLNIVESKNRDEGGFERQSVILFAEDLQEFLKGFDESLRVMEKAVREKRRGPPARRAPTGDDDSEPPNRRRAEREFSGAPRRRPGRNVPERSAHEGGERPRRPGFRKNTASREDGRYRENNNDRPAFSRDTPPRSGRPEGPPRKKRVVVRKP